MSAPSTRRGLAVVILLCFASGCASVPTSARTEVSSKTIAYFWRPGQAPTVVLQSGLGDGKSTWASVIERMPQSVSIFAYDRPGYGGSPGASEARDPCAISRELRGLLENVGAKPPYVLVGHSLGGLYQFCYAKLYPEEVAGLVLLDPTHPKHWERMQHDAAEQAALVSGLRVAAFSRVMRQEFDGQAGCLETLDLNTALARPGRLLFSTRFRLGEQGDFEKMARALRKEWLAQFSNAEHSEVSGSGHYIQKDAPDSVVRAIQDLIASNLKR